MKTIDKKELKRKLDGGEDFALIEVLDEEDFKAGHIKGAIHMSVTRIGMMAKKKFDKDYEIVVYCADEDCGASPAAAEKLVKMGFENVYDYPGGKRDWYEAGYPIVKN